MISYRDLEIAKEASDRLVSLFGDRIEKVILFGSRARGDSNDGSDYDFLVIGDIGQGRMLKNLEVCGRAIADFSPENDILVYTKDEYESKCLLKLSIDKEGVILYDKSWGRLDKKSLWRSDISKTLSRVQGLE